MTPAIRPASREHLPAAAGLLAASLGFAPADAVPAWLMRTTDDCGGVTLVAIEGGAVLAALHSIAGCERDGTYLFVCGLAVAAPHRGRRLGLALMLGLRRRAALAGHGAIRWTADPVNGRALRLYLNGLRARVTAYRPGLHDGLRDGPGHPQDDLDLTWLLRGEPAATDGRAVELELPWSRPALADRSRVRDRMTRLLDEGFEGVDVRVDREARRCWAVFERRCP